MVFRRDVGEFCCSCLRLLRGDGDDVVVHPELVRLCLEDDSERRRAEWEVRSDVPGCGQNQTRFVVAPCAPQFSLANGWPGIFTYAYFTFSVERIEPVEASLPQMRNTSCSPRLNVFVCVHPTGLGFAPAGRVPFTVSA